MCHPETGDCICPAGKEGMECKQSTSVNEQNETMKCERFTWVSLCAMYDI